jgi:hypothetical protein
MTHYLSLLPERERAPGQGVSTMITITQQAQTGLAEVAVHLNGTAGSSHSLDYDDQQEHEQE